MKRRGALFSTWSSLSACSVFAADLATAAPIAPADSPFAADEQTTREELLPDTADPDLTPLFAPSMGDEAGLPEPVVPIPEVVAPSPAASEREDASAVRPLRRIRIDIEPGREGPALIGVSDGVAVAVLAAPDFDVAQIDGATLLFGPARASPDAETRLRLRDVNGDGRDDLIARFRSEQLGIGPQHTRACLTGTTRSGAPFKGCADVRAAP